MQVGQAVAQWFKHYGTSWKVVGLRPYEFNFLNLLNPYGRTRPWGLLSL
jgi:hypothetical protein